MAVILPIIAVLAGGGAGAGYFFMHHAKAGPAASSDSSAPAAAPETGPEFPLHLDSFTVNLADPENTNFLRITIDLGLGHEPKGGGGKRTHPEYLPRVCATRFSPCSPLAKGAESGYGGRQSAAEAEPCECASTIKCPSWM